ncbi:MAG: serine hydrolase domain-containing protein [Rudaea sp.]
MNPARRYPLTTRFLLLLALLPAAVSAQPLATDAYRQSLQRGVDSGLYRELAVGWIDAGQPQTWYYGRAHKPGADSRFEIGAASEIFTGLLLAQAAYERKVRLDSPLHEWLPPGFVCADSALCALELHRLALHHSGLPAQPPNLFPADATDVYAGYNTADLLTFLARYQQSAAARNNPYSVLDAGLLGYALGRAYAQPYPELLALHILKPLGMTSTSLDDGQNLLPGYGHGRPSVHWHFDALAGAAGLRSTLPDLLGFMRQQLQPGKSPLRAALLLSRQPQSDAQQSAGLGWNTLAVAADDQTWPLVWRASRTAGFSVFLGFRTDRQQALVLLGNTDADLSAIGIAWLQALPPPPLLPAPPVAPTSAALAAYPGLYQIRAGGTFVVRSGTDGLSAQFPGQFPVTLHAIGIDVFAAAADAIMLSFQRQAQTVDSALLNQAGANVLAQRLSAGAPVLSRTPMALAPQTLAQYAGDYRLNADSRLRVALDTGHLSMQATGSARIALTAFAPDRFSCAHGVCEVHFARDEHGAVNQVNVSLAGAERVATRLPAAK